MEKVFENVELSRLPHRFADGCGVAGKVRAKKMKGNIVSPLVSAISELQGFSFV